MGGDGGRGGENLSRGGYAARGDTSSMPGNSRRGGENVLGDT